MSKKVLGPFHLVMINVIAVASLRSLPFSSVYGSSLLFFYVLAGLLFFLPAALVSAELGTGWPNTGGIYVWVREAFGKKCSLLIIWLSWMYNIVWYPTILALIAGTITYLFDPDLATNRWYMAASVIILFWLSTWVNLHGMKVSSWISTIGAIAGTLFPMICIIILGIVWLVSGLPLSSTFTNSHWIPNLFSEANLAFLTNVLFALLGLEMSATHAAEMKNPQRDYPKAIWISSIMIWTFMILSSLGIALVVPSQELNLATGVMQAFESFFKSLHVSWAVPIIAICVILGGLSAISTWVIGPSKGIMVSCQDSKMPAFFSKKNDHNVPRGILISQAILVSILSLAFIFFPTVNSSFWFLSAITAQLALIVYIFLFLSALKLHYHKPHVSRSFRVPGKSIGMWIVCSLGILSCVTVIGLGFIPPTQIQIGNVFLYESCLFASMIFLCLIPFFIMKKYKKNI